MSRLFKAAIAVAAFTCLAAPTHARGDIADRLPGLTRLSEEVASAKGPFAYAALRKVWREWDQEDPQEVEELLTAAAHDPGAAPPARAYAGLLEAYARRRRGDLDGARSRIAELGYVGRWLVVGPFDNEGKGGFDHAYGPEDDRLQALSPARAYDGKERTVRWRVVPAASPYGWFDIGVVLRPQESICAYVTTFVRDSRTKEKVGARPISLWAGSAGAMRVWWNGTEVLKDDKYRDLDSDRFASEVMLEPGWNRVLVKLCGEESAPMLSLRLAGRDGGPDANLETDPNPQYAVEAARRSALPFSQTAQPSGGVGPGTPRAVLGPNPSPTPPPQPPAPQRTARKVTGGVEGPIQAFERLSRSGDASAVEAYARYLVTTQSDDHAAHDARALAEKAATRAPTIDRLLFASELVEGRNQRAVWLEKAEALAAKGAPTAEQKINLLLARAAHERGGSNWRDAVPFYDQVLALDRDNVEATLARFELYTAAGLRETARTILDKALSRRPRSVALVRAMAAALREEDRTTEADEMEERYAALRFDDPVYARERIELAIASRDAASAARWIDRLIATNPDSAAAFATAAKALQALGDRPSAIAMYKRSLDLAPEDTDTMKALGDVYAESGQRDEQLKLLKAVVLLLPQSTDVKLYLAHLEPTKPRADEAYARPSREFLAQKDQPAKGQARRTLVDLQVTTVFPNGLASRFHQVVFQPLTDAAAAEAREYAFGFEADTESVQLRGARVYRADGKIDEASESGEGPADNPALSTYTSARAFYVHFPRLQPNDVVELLYRVEDVAPRNAFADYFGEVVYLQSSEPVGRAEYVLLTPKSRAFYFNHPRVPGLVSDVAEQGEQRIYHFVAANVPAVEPEANQPPFGEVLGHVHVSTYKTWDDMGRWYWGLVKDQFVADDEVRQRVLDVTRGKKTDREKVSAIYDYVVEKTRYVALEFGIHGFKPYRCAQIFARGFGDCKDKATLIVTMLKEVGIPSTIVIVRSGMKGEFETEPASLAPFDHAIAYVPSLDLYLDGTAEYTGSGELPAMDRGSLALQINEGHAKLVHLPDPPASESVNLRTFDVTIAPDGAAQLDWHAEVTGVMAAGLRQFYHADVTRQARLEEYLSNEYPGLLVTSSEANNLEDVEENVSLHVRAKVPQFAHKDGDSLVIPAGPRAHMVRDFAPLSRRHLDIRLSAETVARSEWTIHIPPGMHVTSGARPGHMDTPFASYEVVTEGAGPTVQVKTTVTFKKTRIWAQDYAAFRAFCEAADAALDQRVIVGR